MADFLVGLLVMPVGLYQDLKMWPYGISCEAWIALAAVFLQYHELIASMVYFFH